MLTVFYTANGQTDTCSCDKLQTVTKAAIETYRDLKKCEVVRDSSLETIKDQRKQLSLKDSIIKQDSIATAVLSRENKNAFEREQKAVEEKKKFRTRLKYALIGLAAETVYIIIDRAWLHQ